MFEDPCPYLWMHETLCGYEMICMDHAWTCLLVHAYPYRCIWKYMWTGRDLQDLRKIWHLLAQSPHTFLPHTPKITHNPLNTHTLILNIHTHTCKRLTDTYPLHTHTQHTSHNTHAHTHTYTIIQPHAHMICPLAHALTPTRTHTLSHTSTLTYAHTHTHTYTHSFTHTSTLTHAHTHTHTTHTHVHTYSCLYSVLESSFQIAF